MCAHKASEFSIIARYFAPLSEDALIDDAIAVGCPSGMEWVMTTDSMQEGIHFIGDESPAALAQKLLRVNLSDLAAKGARPRHYFLNIGLPSGTGENWIAGFADGLKQDQKQFGLTLAGGDSTNTKRDISLSITVMGLVPAGGMTRRSGARAGDRIYVTGTIGDGFLGLLAAKGKLDAPAMLARYRMPTPRCDLGIAIRGLATAAMDISDGLLQDLGHLCRASGLGADLVLEQVPHSADGVAWHDGDEERRMALLSGGDDYELLFTMPEFLEHHLLSIATQTATSVACIGQMTKGNAWQLRNAKGDILNVTEEGYSHRFI